MIRENISQSTREGELAPAGDQVREGPAHGHYRREKQHRVMGVQPHTLPATTMPLVYTDNSGRFRLKYDLFIPIPAGMERE